MFWEQASTRSKDWLAKAIKELCGVMVLYLDRGLGYTQVNETSDKVRNVHLRYVYFTIVNFISKGKTTTN